MTAPLFTEHLDVIEQLYRRPAEAREAVGELALHTIGTGPLDPIRQPRLREIKIARSRAHRRTARAGG